MSTTWINEGTTRLWRTSHCDCSIEANLGHGAKRMRYIVWRMRWQPLLNVSIRWMRRRLVQLWESPLLTRKHLPGYIIEFDRIGAQSNHKLGIAHDKAHENVLVDMFGCENIICAESPWSSDRYDHMKTITRRHVCLYTLACSMILKGTIKGNFRCTSRDNWRLRVSLVFLTEIELYLNLRYHLIQSNPLVWETIAKTANVSGDMRNNFEEYFYLFKVTSKEIYLDSTLWKICTCVYQLPSS